MTLKFYNLLVFFAILFGALNINAQTQLTPVRIGTDNFTSFTPEKTYDDMSKLEAITPPAYHNNPDFGIRINDKTEWYEQIDKRTLKNRTYSGPGNQIVIESGYNNLNYIDANGWYRSVNTKLKPSSTGWSAEQQETPVYLYKDGSTALSLGGSELMTFNKNVQFNGISISTTNYTVGDNGMYVKNATVNTDKIVHFGRGRIETDYKITQPLKLSGSLSIGEDILLPAGYTITENESYNPETERPGSLIVKARDGKVVAIFKAPYCYDNNRNSIIGRYQLEKQNGGYRLQVVVPSAWLNDPLRQYPVTIDPAVQGGTAVWGGGIIGSCLNSFGSNDTGTIYAAVPPGVTITGVYVQSTFYTDSLPTDDGEMFFWTPCGDTIPSDTVGNTIGWVHIAPPYNFNLLDSTYSRCILPSCSYQNIPITMGILRFAGPSGCNAKYIYYDPSNDQNLPFEAYVVGNTIEGSWSIPNNNLCGNVCNFTIDINSDYGVPPYTISHPWAKSDIIFGRYSSSTATSKGDTSIMLTIPDCDTITSTTLKVKAPTITDACGDTISGLVVNLLSIVVPPDKPTIMQNGDELTSSATQGNQWMRNDTILQGATNQNYDATISGWYQVIAENPANGCSTTSDSIDVITGINQLLVYSSQLSIYPNPANNLTTVEFTASVAKVRLELINVLGQTLYSEILTPVKGNKYSTNLNLAQFPAGVYEVVIATQSQSVAKEVIKQE